MFCVLLNVFKVHVKMKGFEHEKIKFTFIKFIIPCELLLTFTNAVWKLLLVHLEIQETSHNYTMALAVKNSTCLEVANAKTFAQNLTMFVLLCTLLSSTYAWALSICYIVKFSPIFFSQLPENPTSIANKSVKYF